MPPNHVAAIGTPRWVKMFGVVGLLLLVALVVLHLTGNTLGGHGHRAPAAHTPAAGGRP